LNLPITPFHFGPGALVKVIAPKHFSWSIFALSNVLIDLEPVTLFLLIGDPAHPWLHTLPGAIAVAAFTATLGRKPCEIALCWWNGRLSSGWQTRWIAVEPRISRSTAWISALIGTLSHLALDSIMHTDVEALWPIIAGNQIQGIISLDVLHGFCVATALMALLVWPIARRYSGASQ
jgi:hypothetical protein